MSAGACPERSRRAGMTEKALRQCHSRESGSPLACKRVCNSRQPASDISIGEFVGVGKEDHGNESFFPGCKCY
jgi:hypothetical protein